MERSQGRPLSLEFACPHEGLFGACEEVRRARRTLAADDRDGAIDQFARPFEIILEPLLAAALEQQTRDPLEQRFCRLDQTENQVIVVLPELLVGLQGLALCFTKKMLRLAIIALLYPLGKLVVELAKSLESGPGLLFETEGLARELYRVLCPGPGAAGYLSRLEEPLFVEQAERMLV